MYVPAIVAAGLRASLWADPFRWFAARFAVYVAAGAVATVLFLVVTGAYAYLHSSAPEAVPLQFLVPVSTPAAPPSPVEPTADIPSAVASGRTEVPRRAAAAGAASEVPQVAASARREQEPLGFAAAARSPDALPPVLPHIVSGVANRRTTATLGTDRADNWL